MALDQTNGRHTDAGVVAAAKAAAPAASARAEGGLLSGGFLPLAALCLGFVAFLQRAATPPPGASST